MYFIEKLHIRKGVMKYAARDSAGTVTSSLGNSFMKYQNRCSLRSISETSTVIGFLLGLFLIPDNYIKFKIKFCFTREVDTQFDLHNKHSCSLAAPP